MAPLNNNNNRVKMELLLFIPAALRQWNRKAENIWYSTDSQLCLHDVHITYPWKRATESTQIRKKKSASTSKTFKIISCLLQPQSRKKTSGRLWWNSFNEIKDCADFPTKLKWNVWPVTYCKSLKQQNEHHFLCQYTDGLPLPLVLQCFVTSVSGSLRTLPNLCPFFIKNQH